MAGLEALNTTKRIDPCVLSIPAGLLAWLPPNLSVTLDNLNGLYLWPIYTSMSWYLIPHNSRHRSRYNSYHFPKKCIPCAGLLTPKNSKNIRANASKCASIPNKPYDFRNFLKNILQHPYIVICKACFFIGHSYTQALLWLFPAFTPHQSPYFSIKYRKICSDYPVLRSFLLFSL